MKLGLLQEFSEMAERDTIERIFKKQQENNFLLVSAILGHEMK
jgi:hypothetical protein